MDARIAASRDRRCLGHDEPPNSAYRCKRTAA
jgi:hypothetical protein